MAYLQGGVSSLQRATSAGCSGLHVVVGLQEAAGNGARLQRASFPNMQEGVTCVNPI